LVLLHDNGFCEGYITKHGIAQQNVSYGFVTIVTFIKDDSYKLLDSLLLSQHKASIA
jgi:hypothetical protein